MFERENEFYEENKDSLHKQYLGKENVIRIPTFLVSR
jgi:hypothetical protein